MDNNENNKVENSTVVPSSNVENNVVSQDNNLDTAVQTNTVVEANSIDEGNNTASPVSEESENALPIIDPLKPVVPQEDNTVKVEEDKPSDVESNNPMSFSAPAPRVVNHNIDSLNKNHVENPLKEEPKQENVEKVETNVEDPGSKVRLFAMFLFFILILLFVLNLDKITELVDTYRNKNAEIEMNESVSSGQLKCNLKSNTADLDIERYNVFYFNYRKIFKVEMEITTEGDSASDVATLDGINANCENLRQKTSGMAGVNISCVNMEGKVIERQSFDLPSLDVEAFNSSYSEAGGTVLEFRDGQDVDLVQKNLESSGYICDIIPTN